MAQMKIDIAGNEGTAVESGRPEAPHKVSLVIDYRSRVCENSG